MAVTRLLLLLSATAFIKAFQRRTTVTTSLLWHGISRSSPLHYRSCRPCLHTTRYQPLTATTFNDRNPNDNKGIIDDENDFQDTEDDDSIDDEDEDDDELENEDQTLHPPKEGSLRLKVRQHVNPLASTYQKPTEFEENWVQNAFAQPNLPTIVDIGCAKGTWVLKSGLQNPGMNVLGLEIRRPVVQFALQRKQRWGLNNVHFLSVNANIDLPRILMDLKQAGAQLHMVSIQFPDPHFKNKHKKRRVVNASLVETIVSQLEVGKLVFVQSDVLDVLEDMVQNFSRHPQLATVEGYNINALDQNLSPNPVLTEREIATGNKGLPVYRMLFRKI